MASPGKLVQSRSFAACQCGQGRQIGFVGEAGVPGAVQGVCVATCDAEEGAAYASDVCRSARASSTRAAPFGLRKCCSAVPQSTLERDAGRACLGASWVSLLVLARVGPGSGLGVGDTAVGG